jgi:hypothetical protein
MFIRKSRSLNESEIKHYSKKLKHYCTDDETFADRIFRLFNAPYIDVADMLYKESFKEFNESEHHYAMNQIPL